MLLSKNNIKFVERTHQYFSGNEELISVSKFTERFKQKVDWKAIAQRTASKLTREGNPTSTTQVLKKWEKKRNTSAEIGTLYHSIREEELLSSDKARKHSKTINGEKLSIPIHQLEKNTIYPELMIYDTDYMICGQSDKVITTDNTINIYDYKTDKEISFQAFRSQWTEPEKFLKPIDHLEDCNGNLYTIKMSTYLYLLWKANKGRFKPGELIIEHITLERDPNNDDIPVLKNGKPVVLGIKEIKLPYLKKEVIAMLKTLKPT